MRKTDGYVKGRINLKKEVDKIINAIERIIIVGVDQQIKWENKISRREAQKLRTIMVESEMDIDKFTDHLNNCSESIKWGCLMVHPYYDQSKRAIVFQEGDFKFTEDD